MAEIDGFKYESWERSSSVARRDFHAAKGGPEELPHRTKRGKKSTKKKGCPENDNGPHIYVWIKTVSWYNKRWYDGYSKRCAGCDKPGDYNWRYVPEPEEIYEVRTIPRFSWYRY